MNEPGAAAEAVVQIVSEALEVPAQALRTQPVLAAHAWDSLSSLEALCQLEQRFAISLDLRAYHATRTVDELVELVTAGRTGAAA